MLITGTRVKMLKRATLMNDVKAWLLVSAMLAEVVAVGAVAVAVGEILVGSPGTELEFAL